MKFPIALLLSFGNGFAQSGCAELHQMIVQTYNAAPSELNDAQQKAKAVEMDGVWAKVEASPTELTPCLQKELANAEPASWLFFDGTALLMKVAPQAKETAALRLKAFEKVPLKDVDLRVWVEGVAALGVRGLDTRLAAERWLHDKDPQYVAPEHALTVNRFTGAMILYGSMDESFATPELVRISSLRNHPGRDTAVRLLIDQATPEAWATLKALDASFLPPQGQKMLAAVLAQSPVYQPKAASPVNREQFLAAIETVAAKQDPSELEDLVGTDPAAFLNAVAVLKTGDIAAIRRARRTLMASSSDERLHLARLLTPILYTLVHRRP